MTPRRWGTTGEAEVHCQAEINNREAMRKGSETLRDRIFALLAERDAKFSAKVRGHEQARKAIARGIAAEDVKALFDLSDTAYEQLAAQVRAGCTA